MRRDSIFSGCNPGTATTTSGSVTQLSPLFLVCRAGVADTCARGAVAITAWVFASVIRTTLSASISMTRGGGVGGFLAQKFGEYRCGRGTSSQRCIMDAR